MNVLRIINEPTAAAIAYGLDIHARNDTSILCSLSLGIIEVCGYSNNSIFDLMSEVGFGSFLHLKENHAADFFWSEGFSFTLVLNLNFRFGAGVSYLEWPMLHIGLN